MISKGSWLYSLIFLSLSFTACQKDVLVGDKDYRTLGSSAHDLLSSSTYSSLVVEINYMPGYAPDATTINNLDSFLKALINKPGGIRITVKEIASSGQSSLSINDIVEIEKGSRSFYTFDNLIAVHILVSDCYFSNKNVFATSYWNTSFCLSGKNIFDNSGRQGQVTRTELLSTLMKHEFGHLLGLVDQGTAMQTNHKDFENGAHCNNPHCLMNYAIETANIGDSATAVPSLDLNCITDLKANGGK
jgi:hypothetical protein